MHIVFRASEESSSNTRGIQRLVNAAVVDIDVVLRLSRNLRDVRVGAVKCGGVQ